MSDGPHGSRRHVRDDQSKPDHIRSVTCQTTGYSPRRPDLPLNLHYWQKHLEQESCRIRSKNP